MTELFGPCGKGWRFEIVDRRLQPVGDGQIICFVDINLFYKTDENTWSAPIPGTGGNYFIRSTGNGLQVNDECFKMALTDAQSVAMKQIGIAADVYYKEDITKYGSFAPDPQGYFDPQTMFAAGQAYQPAQPVEAAQYPNPGYQQAPAQQMPPQAVPQTAYTGDPVQQAAPAQEYAQPAPQPDMAQPMTLEQAKAVVCNVGYHKGKTLGEIMQIESRWMDSLDFVSRMGLSAMEKEAARLLRMSVIK